MAETNFDYQSITRISLECWFSQINGFHVKVFLYARLSTLLVLARQEFDWSYWRRTILKKITNIIIIVLNLCQPSVLYLRNLIHHVEILVVIQSSLIPAVGLTKTVFLTISRTWVHGWNGCNRCPSTGKQSVRASGSRLCLCIFHSSRLLLLEKFREWLMVHSVTDKGIWGECWKHGYLKNADQSQRYGVNVQVANRWLLLWQQATGV